MATGDIKVLRENESGNYDEINLEEVTGDFAYTEENVISSAETITASLDKLDVAVGDIASALDTINGEEV